MIYNLCCTPELFVNKCNFSIIYKIALPLTVTNPKPEITQKGTLFLNVQFTGHWLDLPATKIRPLFRCLFLIEEDYPYHIHWK